MTTILAGALLMSTGNSQDRSVLHQWRASRSAGETVEYSSNNQTFQDNREYEERQFAQRVDSLLVALTNFSLSYKTGHVIDVKKVNAVRKALRELEKSEWFILKKNE